MNILVKRGIVVIVLGSFIQGLCVEADAQQVGTWKNYTDMKTLRAIAISHGVLWGATSGGLFSSSSNGSTVKYTNAEGLSSNDLTALAADTRGRLWIGSAQGTIDILDPANGQWMHVNDIAQSNRIQKGIRSFFITGDSVFVTTDFGVSVFRLSRWEFGDTYANFGFSTQASVNRMLIVNDRLWLATTLGVATAPRYALNLSSPSSWSRYQTTDGLPANEVTSIAAFHDTVVVGTTLGAAYQSGPGFQTMTSTSGMQMKALSTSPNRLILLWNRPPYALAAVPNVADSVAPGLSDPRWMGSDILTDSTGATIYIATVGNGIHQRGPVNATILPNGPQSNLFSSLAVDGRGVLWTASGISGQGTGFSRFDPSAAEPERWKNFTVGDYPVMGSNDYYKVGLGTGGTIWVSSWGDGAVQVAADSIVRRLDTSSQPSFSTSDDTNPFYPVINGVAVDQRGQTWFSNWGAINRNFLACLTSDTTFTYYTSGLIGQGFFTSIAIDENGTKWMANAQPFHPAKGSFLYYLNEDNLVSGTIGGWGYMSESDGLPNNTVLSVAVDQGGSVCVGTALGMMIISEPLYPKQRHFSSFPLREQSIQAIAVDAVNNKWVGTKEGVFVMNADATQILRQYTVSSTGGKLVDNDIRAIAIDQQRGRAYIGTEKGLSSIEIAPVATVRTFTTIAVGPNPFRIPSAIPLEVRNLVPDTFIKILAVDGSLVTDFRAQGGGRAFWDGTNASGSLVASGIYFIIAYADNGDQIGSGKVAVIRR